MKSTDKIKEHMEVLGSDGKHVGMVDCLDGSGGITLTKNDPKANGQHHTIPMAWVDHVDQHVHLNKSCDFATTQWHAA